MTAKYIADTNELQELGMEKPTIPGLSYNSPAGFDAAMRIVGATLKEYNAHLATLRTIPCSPECRGLWKVGQVLEEGREYYLRPMCNGSLTANLCGVIEVCEHCALTAFPLPVKSEAPFLWTDELVKEYAEQYRFSSSRISIEQFKHILIKKITYGSNIS